MTITKLEDRPLTIQKDMPFGQIMSRIASLCHPEPAGCAGQNGV